VRSLTCAVALGLVFAAAASSARADAPQTDAARREALDHYAKALVLHRSGAYTEAIGEYEAAYALYASPSFLINLGDVCRLAGRRDQAVARYEAYLALDPHGPGADAARAHIAELTGGTPAAITESTPPPETVPSTPVAVSAARMPPPVSLERGDDARRPAGYALAAAGAASLSVAIISSIVLWQRQQTIDAHCDATYLCDAQGLTAAQSKNGLAVASTLTWTVGAMATGLGTYLLVTSHRPAPIALAPAVGAGFGGLVLGARY
jgi:tetratricopeptide (TPR) repeat protein